MLVFGGFKCGIFNLFEHFWVIWSLFELFFWILNYEIIFEISIKIHLGLELFQKLNCGIFNLLSFGFSGVFLSIFG